MWFETFPRKTSILNAVPKTTISVPYCLKSETNNLQSRGPEPKSQAKYSRRLPITFRKITLLLVWFCRFIRNLFRELIVSEYNVLWKRQVYQKFQGSYKTINIFKPKKKTVNSKMFFLLFRKHKKKYPFSLGTSVFSYLIKRMAEWTRYCFWNTLRIENIFDEKSLQ